MRPSAISLLMSLLCLLLFTSPSLAAGKQIVAGAGPSTKVVELFFAEFEKRAESLGTQFVIPAMSTKHAGGIANCDTNLFGRTGRPLNDKELAKDKKDLFLAKVPIAFATGEAARHAPLTRADLEKIFRGEISNWKQLGGPDVAIVTVGREPSEALFLELKEEYPFFKEAKFNIIFKKDHDVVNFLKSPVGTYAIAFGAKPNFSEVKTLDIADVEAGVRLGLVYDAKNQANPIVQGAIQFAGSDDWRQAVIGAGLIPVSKVQR